MLIGSVKLTKNADLDKYKDNSYSIGFDSSSEFSLLDGTMGKNVIIFWAIWAHLSMLKIREKIT